MKILHRIYDLYSGGAEAVLLSFIEAFPEHSHIVVFTNYYETWLADDLSRHPNVQLVRGTLRSTPRIIRLEAPDWIMFHRYAPMAEADFEGLSAAALRKTVIYSHTCSPLPSVRGVDRYWFVSPFACKASAGAATGARLSIILNPVRERFFERTRRRAHDQFTVGRHSRPSPAKFSSDFIDIHERISIPSLKVAILGAPPRLADSIQSSRSKHRHAYAVYEFNTLDAAEFLRKLDVFLYKVSPRCEEACPLAVLEAMASGVPVVAENRAGVADILSAAQTGFPCTESSQYVEAVERLWRDRDLWRAMSAAGRRWALENTSLPAYRAKVLAALS